MCGGFVTVSTGSTPGATEGRRGLSLARLDRFYCFKHHLNNFKRCCIQPVGFSDPFLVSCHVFIKNIHVKSAYWHFNTALLDDQAFRTAFKFFWESHRESRPAFTNIQQWWDFGKTQIKQLCQQFTRGVTTDFTQSMKELETQVVELQSLADSTANLLPSFTETCLRVSGHIIQMCTAAPSAVSLRSARLPTVNWQQR